MLTARARRTRPIGRFVEVGGVRVHTLVEGEGGAFDVVLLHGASGNLRDFRFDLIGRLVPHARVVAFDRPGLGFTPALHRGGESPAEQAAVLSGAAAKIGVERPVIVGHSYGGAVAMAWALNHPERAAALVNLAGATMPWPGKLWSWYPVASSWLGGATVVPLVSLLLPRWVAERTLRSIFEPQDPPRGYMDGVGLDLILRPSQLRANAGQINVLRDHVQAMSERYPTLDLPVESVHGDADTIVPLEVHSRPLTALIPKARLTVLEGVGHMVHHADPDAAAAAVLRAAGRAGLR